MKARRKVGRRRTVSGALALAIAAAGPNETTHLLPPTHSPVGLACVIGGLNTQPPHGGLLLLGTRRTRLPCNVRNTHDASRNLLPPQAAHWSVVARAATSRSS